MLAGIRSSHMKSLIIMFAVAACCCVSAGELGDLYLKKVRVNPGEWLKQQMQAWLAASVTSTNHDVTAIGIEHSPCFGECPVYTFIVKSDGTFRYTGGKFAKRQGDFSGTIPTGEIDTLA